MTTPVQPAGRFTAPLLFGPSQVTPQSVAVYTVGTTTPANLFTSKTGVTAAANPVVTDQLGNLELFAVPGDYDLVWHLGDVQCRVTVTVRGDPTEPTQVTVGGVTIRAGLTAALSATPGNVGDIFIAKDGAAAMASNIFFCTVADAAAATYVGIA
jgi:hypothetical protein